MRSHRETTDCIGNPPMEYSINSINRIQLEASDCNGKPVLGIMPMHLYMLSTLQLEVRAIDGMKWKGSNRLIVARRPTIDKVQ